MAFGNSLRRAQLIMPFGVGAIHMQPNGYSLITAGLDDWFTDRNGDALKKDQIERATLIEPRLAATLEVNHFRLPPSEAEQFAEDHLAPSVPVYRFPTWFHCGCGRLLKGRPDETRPPACPKCDAGKDFARRKPQIRFIAACDHGHLQEFPWLEWVHKSSEVSEECATSLTITFQGGATLSDIRVHCKRCGINRSLSGITSGELPKEPDQTGSSFLTSSALDNGSELTCSGQCAWHGPKHSASRCGRPLRGILFNATNLHYSLTQSAIKIPDILRTYTKPLSEVIAGDNELRIALGNGKDLDATAAQLCGLLRKKDGDKLLEAYHEDELRIFVEAFLADTPVPIADHGTITDEEFEVLSQAGSHRDSELVLVEKQIPNTLELLSGMFISVVAVESLTETVAFKGFSRFMGFRPTSAAAPSLDELLWRVPHHSGKERWLPAIQQTGEGIFLRFDTARIAEWKTQPAVEKHFENLMNNQRASLRRRGQGPEQMKGPEYVLIHTLSHLLINRLIFECGYGSASLKERIYCDFSQSKKIAGLLVYTASGDSEGSMGGLVRLSEPDTLERLLYNAINEAQWCSSDPVCREATATGSGPDSLNYAACHSCAMLPETCCESFNSLLDRSLFVRGLSQAFVD
jgi:hypothetical protein